MKKQFKLLSAALCSFAILGWASVNANAQTYCQPSTWQDNSVEWITNVTFAGINNTTGAGTTAYSNFTSTVTPGQVTIGVPYTLSVSIEPDDDEYIYAFIDWNQNGILDNAGEKYVVAAGVGGTGPYTLSITPPATALTGNTRMRIMLDWFDLNGGDPCLGETAFWEEGYGETEDYSITVQSSSPVVTNVAVATQAGVPAMITTNGGTLQMMATVLPATAPQTVTWSIVPGTGTATISAAGLVTAQTNGTVWAKAVSTADISKKDSMQITLSNQVVPVTSVAVATQGGVPATITTGAGTLQMTSTVLPAAAPQTVTWSIVPGTGTATISATGLVTAQTDGIVWAKAVSTADASKKDSLELTLTNQTSVATVVSVSVSVQGGLPAAISTNAGTLQMTSTVLPANATQTVTWSIVPGTGMATISGSGLVTAQTNGTVWAKAVSTVEPAIFDSLQILISNQGTGLNDLFASGAVTVYPNPVSNEIHIDFQSWNAEPFNVSIVNLLGQELYQAKIDNKKTVHNIANLASGIYILNVNDTKGNRSGIKIHKQ